MLGLPDRTEACLFDLDGVITRTAGLHAAAWAEAFDALLRARVARTGEPFVAFDPVRDYELYVDGRPRADGARQFLVSRGIDLPEGTPDDPPDAETVEGVARRKDELVHRLIQKRGVAAFEDSVRYVRAARDVGLRTAIVSSSRHCREVLEAAAISDLFEVRVDGAVAEARRLRGKPQPDSYLAAAELLGVAPARCAVFEDALAGVEAGRAGGFGCVVGVDRLGQADALRRHGADVVVAGLGELLEAR
jgi:beta-phosphoglucomutase family hydrolase